MVLDKLDCLLSWVNEVIILMYLLDCEKVLLIDIWHYVSYTPPIFFQRLVWGGGGGLDPRALKLLKFFDRIMIFQLLVKLFARYIKHQMHIKFA